VCTGTARERPKGRAESVTSQLFLICDSRHRLCVSRVRRDLRARVAIRHQDKLNTSIESCAPQEYPSANRSPARLPPTRRKEP